MLTITSIQSFSLRCDFGADWFIELILGSRELGQKHYIFEMFYYSKYYKVDTASQYFILMLAFSPRSEHIFAVNKSEIECSSVLRRQSRTPRHFACSNGTPKVV